MLSLSAQPPCGIKKPPDFNRQEKGRRVDFLRRVSLEKLNWCQDLREICRAASANILRRLTDFQVVSKMVS